MVTCVAPQADGRLKVGGIVASASRQVGNGLVIE
jgi:hypothetical protein